MGQCLAGEWGSRGGFWLVCFFKIGGITAYLCADGNDQIEGGNTDDGERVGTSVQVWELVSILNSQ